MSTPLPHSLAKCLPIDASGASAMMPGEKCKRRWVSLSGGTSAWSTSLCVAKYAEASVQARLGPLRASVADAKISTAIISGQVILLPAWVFDVRYVWRACGVKGVRGNTRNAIEEFELQRH